MPPAITIWRDALSHVITDIDRLIFGRKPTDSGYVFPDPGLFVGVTTGQRQGLYFFNWLKYRSALIHRQAFSSSASPINNQQWRTLLYLPLDHNPSAPPKKRKLAAQPIAASQPTSSSQPPSSSQPNRFQRTEDIVQNLLKKCLDLDEEIVLRSEATMGSWWNGHKITSGSIPPINVAQQILWELFELNFRYEFFALDARAHVPVEDTNQPPRERLILACFPGRASLVAAPLQSAREGLGAPNWRARRSFVVAMRTVMQTWKGFLGYGFHLTKDVCDLSEREFHELESAVAHFYTQSFYDYFARAAIVPHTLPSL